MTAAAGLLPVDQNLVATIQKQDAAGVARPLQLVDHLKQEGMIRPAPHIHHKGDLVLFFRAGGKELGKLQDQLDGHIVDAVIADILQNVHRDAFPGAAHAGDDQTIHKGSLLKKFL